MKLARTSLTNFLVILLWCALSGSSGGKRKRWAINDSGCRTPGRGVGSCIDSNKCKSMIDFHTENPVIDNRTKTALDKYICGYENSTIKICCPSTPIDLGWMEGDSCTTPDRMIGNCISLQSCKVMLDVTYVRADTEQILRDYSCGFDAYNHTKVCCPSTPITVQFADISAHTNINLLPMQNCGVTADLDRIVNGNKSQIFEFPWIAALKYFRKGRIDFGCGGTLINDRYVLTAAHCIKTVKIHLIGVRLGEYDFNNEPDCEFRQNNKTICAPPVQHFDVTASDAIIHPTYNTTTLVNDIALIRLPRPANVNGKSVVPICLPVLPSIRNRALAKKLIVTGWGATETGFKSSVLLKVKVPVIQNEECKKNYITTRDIFDSQLCAGGKNNQDSCAGDSGGPLLGRIPENGILKTYQYGIVSFGPKYCAIRNKPVIYSRITSYLHWILDNIKE